LTAFGKTLSWGSSRSLGPPKLQPYGSSSSSQRFSDSISGALHRSSERPSQSIPRNDIVSNISEDSLFTTVSATKGNNKTVGPKYSEVTLPSYSNAESVSEDGLALSSEAALPSYSYIESIGGNGQNYSEVALPGYSNEESTSDDGLVLSEAALPSYSHAESVGGDDSSSIKYISDDGLALSEAPLPSYSHAESIDDNDSPSIKSNTGHRSPPSSNDLPESNTHALKSSFKERDFLEQWSPQRTTL
jgi:hypothetical protein